MSHSFKVIPFIKPWEGNIKENLDDLGYDDAFFIF